MHPSSTVTTAARAARLRSLRDHRDAAAERSRLSGAAAELGDWLAGAPVVGLDEIDTMAGVRETLLGALWEARLHQGRAPRAEQLVRHALVTCTPAELSRHADLVRDLLAALPPGARTALLAELGPEGSLRRGFVEALARPASRAARTYAAY